MKAEIVNLERDQYLKIELIPFKQKNNLFYVSKIRAKEFLEIFTVQPARYDYIKNSQLANSFPDERDYYNHLINIDQKNINHKDFQREANYERVREIRDFLEREEFAFFPNTIIANCELINNREEFSINQTNAIEEFSAITNKPQYLSFLQEIDQKYLLYVPYRSDSVLVIDGQHRLEGLKLTSEEVINNYDLLVCFIIGYDRSVIAQQFYTINYEQRPVNKSLLIQLTGEFSKGRGEISHLHTVVKILNELENSPFFQRVKMLGITPKDLPANERKMLTVSQAFLVDNLLRLISVSAKQTMYPPIFLKFYQNEDERIEIVKIIARFFTAVRNLKPEWDTPEVSIISKGMGIGALIKTLNLLLPVILKEHEYSWTELKNLKVIDYENYLKGIEEVDFSNDGPYGKIGSGGTLNKLKEEIITKNKYLGPFITYSDFENQYRTDLLNFSIQLL